MVLHYDTDPAAAPCPIFPLMVPFCRPFTDACLCLLIPHFLDNGRAAALVSRREGPRRNWYIFRLGTIIKFPQQFEKVFPLSQKGKKFRRRRKQIIFLAFAKSAFFSTIAEKKIVDDDDNTTDDIFIAVDKTHAIAPYNKTVFTIWIYETVVVALASGFSCSFSAITFLQCFGKNCLLPPPLSFFFF